MGGFVGQRIAARRPELIRSLSLLDTSAGPEDPENVSRYKLLGWIYRLTGITPLRKAVRPIMFGPTFLADASRKPLIEEWERRLARSPRSGIRKAVIAVAERKPVEDEIGRIQAPTLVLVGVDDAATPLAKAQRIAELIPGARLATLPDCGHTSTLEASDTVTGLLRDFLAENTSAH
jgi:pimeloyl-ACP methyl ester carboxylesterase